MGWAWAGSVCCPRRVADCCTTFGDASLRGSPSWTNPTVPPVDLGFETIGNASRRRARREPRPGHRPWIRGVGLLRQLAAAHTNASVPSTTPCRPRSSCVALAGHSDHLNLESLPRLREHPILLPDHTVAASPAISPGLGYRVAGAAVGQWLPITDRLRVASHRRLRPGRASLVDVDGRLVVNPTTPATAAVARSWPREQRRLLERSACSVPHRLRRCRHDQLRRRRRRAATEPRTDPA